MNKKEKEKIFVIINTPRFGDTLLTNTLAANIKNIFKNSKIVRVTNPELYEAAKLQPYTDDVIVWERKGSAHGFWGTLKFVKDFPYKKIFAIIPIFGEDRPSLLARLLNPKYILSESYTGIRNTSLINKLLKKSKYKIVEDTSLSIQERLSNLLTGITKEKIVNYPILFNAPDTNLEKFDYLKKDIENSIIISPISTKIPKDMPIDTIKDLLKLAPNQKFILCGHGKIAEEYSLKLKEDKPNNLIDIVNATTISELAEICSKSKAVISVDTGTLHLSVALKKPTVGVFYDELNLWCPSEKLYNIKIINKDKSAENIWQTVKTICQNNNY